jgi:ring-1,2-phenylacetyl-CoA epoxidase subunit PaaE
MKTYTLKVVDIKKEGEDSITLCFKQPALRKIKYMAGQYLTLIFRINGRRYIRPYSFSSAPSVDNQLEVTVKRVQNGIVSNHIHDQLEVGSVIEVMEPMGDFIYKESNADVYFWGVGSGITPLISIIKEILITTPSKIVNLVYGNRDQDNTIFSELINNLGLIYPGRVKVWYFYTRLVLKKDPNIIEGRISKNDALKILDVPGIINTHHYICGPAGLKESVKEALRTVNVPDANIFSEDFQLVKDPRDFVDIKSQYVQLKVYGADYDLEVVKGKSILEAALDAGIEVPYSCQTGSCSTCKACRLNGEVRMIGLLNKREDLGENEYLLCCSYPVSIGVQVKI